MPDGSAAEVRYDGSDHKAIDASDLVDHIVDELGDNEEAIRFMIDELSDTIATALRD